MLPHSGLQADLYELTMAAAYLQTHFDAQATFELFVRNLPAHRNYLVSAGLEQALDFLQNVRFSPQDVDFLRRHPVFRGMDESFFRYLADFRFSGDVWAMPEGTLVFAGEPLLRITAPIAQAQIMETQLLATISFQTMVASKAARVVTSAGDRQVVEFGARRNHGMEAGMYAARAAYIGGCMGTSNVKAGELFGIRTYGTQAHSWVMAHESESQAFQRFLDVFPQHAYLLLDTYDVRGAITKILQIGRRPAGVRLDSGDVVADSKWVRRALDGAGWQQVKIFASGDLDETKIAALLRRKAPIDAFGVGTALATPPDAPHLNLIYKLVQVERGGQVHEAAKLTAAKVTYPGRKQVFRKSAKSGSWQSDIIGLESESFENAEALLIPMMRRGKRLQPPAALDEIRQRCLAGLERLPERYRRIDRSAIYPVHYSPRLEDLLDAVKRRVDGHKNRGPRIRP